MIYTDEQRAILARMDEIAARIREIEAEYSRRNAAAGQNVCDLLMAAIDHGNRLGDLHREHGNAYREFLATL